MKKYSIPISVFILIISMCFCAFGENAITLNEPVRFPMKEGIQPYKFNEREMALLNKYGMNEATAPIFSFRAPAEAKGMEIRFYRWEDGSWQTLRRGFTASVNEAMGAERLEGAITVLMTIDHKFEYRLYQEFGRDYQAIGSNVDFSKFMDFEQVARGFRMLEEHQPIVLEQEMPLAIWVYNDEGLISVLPLTMDAKQPEYAEKFNKLEESFMMTVLFTEESFI